MAADLKDTLQRWPREDVLQLSIKITGRISKEWKQRVEFAEEREPVQGALQAWEWPKGRGWHGQSQKCGTLIARDVLATVGRARRKRGRSTRFPLESLGPQSHHLDP